MAKVKNPKARTDIYKTGLRTPNPNNKQGYSLDRSKPADEEDYIIINKGQKYYTWQLYMSPKQFSLTYPKRQQLTNSNFLRQVWDTEDRIIEFSYDEHGEDGRDEIVQELEMLRDEVQESLDNMPEQLQEGDTGQMLQERIEQVEEMISILEDIDLTEPERGDFTGDESYFNELQIWQDSVNDEIREVTYDGQ